VTIVRKNLEKIQSSPTASPRVCNGPYYVLPDYGLRFTEIATMWHENGYVAGY